MRKNNILRLVYASVAVIVFLTEVYIALYVNDSFIRPYGGDVLVTFLLCALVRSFSVSKPRFLSGYIFVFSVFVELMQYVDLVKLLNLESNAVISVLMGRSFSFIDIICYAAGCLAFAVFEFCLNRFLRTEDQR